METISFDDFKKVDIRVGEIVSVEAVPDTDKLLKLMVLLGEEEPRQIISGIKEYVEDIETLVGRKMLFVANLEPRTIKGFESNGMLFAAHDDEHFAFLIPDTDITPGTRAG